MTTAAIKNTGIKKRRDIVFPIVNTCILILLCFTTLYPVLNTVAYSFNDGLDAVKGGIGLWPRVWSTESYASLMRDPAIYKAFWISFSISYFLHVIKIPTGGICNCRIYPLWVFVKI